MRSVWQVVRMAVLVGVGISCGRGSPPVESVSDAPREAPQVLEVVSAGIPLRLVVDRAEFLPEEGHWETLSGGAVRESGPTGGRVK